MCRDLAARRIGTIFRQRDELDLVAWHTLEAAFLPLVLGLLDALLARRDEIPPDVTRTVERCAADHRDAARLCRGNRDAIGRAKHEKLAGSEFVSRHIDLSRHDVNAALLALGVERHRGARVERHIGEQGFGYSFEGRALAKQRARNDARGLPLSVDRRQLIALEV